MYTLWISLPTENAAGDITITDGKGKFYSFFYGVGGWIVLTRDEQEAILDEWLSSVSILYLSNSDIEDNKTSQNIRSIKRAVLDSRLDR